MERNWIKIFSSVDFFKAELMRQALIEEEIPTVLINKKDSSYGFGQVELYVDHTHEVIARTFIQEMTEDQDI